MEARNPASRFRKSLALLSCVSILLISISSLASCPNCDCAGTNGQDPSCCCTPPDADQERGSCCLPIPQHWTQAFEEVRQDSGCDECGCFDVRPGSEFLMHVDGEPGVPGKTTHNPLETALRSPVDPLARVDEVAFDTPLFPPPAKSLLGTVVLQL